MFFDQLQKLCKQNKTSPTALVQTLGMSKSNVTFWKNGSMPNSEVLSKIAIHFGVSTDYLLGNELSPREEFLSEAKEKYGTRGIEQAKDLLSDVQALFSGGELPEEDKDEFFKVITQMYFEAKEKNKEKYGRKKTAE